MEDDQIEDDQNQRLPKWKTTKIKDDLNKRRPKWKHNQNGRQPK